MLAGVLANTVKVTGNCPSRMKIFITTANSPDIQRRYNFSEWIAGSYRAGRKTPYSLVDSPGEADIIVYWMVHEESELILNPRLRAEKNIADYPEKCFAVDVTDEPIPYLPGVYPALSARHYDAFLHRGGCYGIEMNPSVAMLAPERDSIPDPKYLASFVGGLSAPVRRALIAEPTLQSSCLLRTTPLWHFTTDTRNPSKTEGQELYARQILESKFTLCPRGGGLTSHRIFESMQLGRCPVIISDGWVPPEGVAWQDCSLRVAERKVHQLHSILKEYEPQWQELGRAARRQWEEWFAPDIWVYRTLQSIVDIHLTRISDKPDSTKKWKWLVLDHYYQRSIFKRALRKASRIAQKFKKEQSRTAD